MNMVNFTNGMKALDVEAGIDYDMIDIARSVAPDGHTVVAEDVGQPSNLENPSYFLNRTDLHIIKPITALIGRP